MLRKSGRRWQRLLQPVPCILRQHRPQAGCGAVEFRPETVVVASAEWAQVEATEMGVGGSDDCPCFPPLACSSCRSRTRAVRCWMARRSSAVVILRPSHASTRLAVNDAVDLCLESVNALVEKRCAKVDRRQSSSHRHRWLATALLDIEPRLRRVVRGYRHLPTLRAALKRELKIDTTTSKKQAASAIWSRGEFQLRMGLTHCLHRQASHRYSTGTFRFYGSNTTGVSSLRACAVITSFNASAYPVSHPGSQTYNKPCRRLACVWRAPDGQ